MHTLLEGLTKHSKSQPIPSKCQYDKSTKYHLSKNVVRNEDLMIVTSTKVWQITPAIRFIQFYIAILPLQISRYYFAGETSFIPDCSQMNLNLH